MEGVAKSSPRTGAERVDARDKVTGATRYAADDARIGLLHGALVPSRIARGRITRIDTAAAQLVAGVRLVLTHENIGALQSAGVGFPPFQPLRSAEIAYRGQAVALVVADTPEAACEAAQQVMIAYEAAAFVATCDSPGALPVPQASLLLLLPMFADKSVGDADGAIGAAAVTVDSTYDLPAQHQNPMELIATVAEWKGDLLTVQESTQNAEGVRHGLAKLLGLDPAQVRVRSPTVGGGFGQKNALQPHTVLVAMAARMLSLPVKLVVSRAQLFQAASFRPAARHRIRLGSERGGRLVAAVHEIDQQTSRYDAFPSQGADMTSRLYGIANYRSVNRLVLTDTQTPGYMRAPHEHPASFAFESAVDEMAYALDMDPLALRLLNDTQTDAITGKPFSSRHAQECLTQGALTFGWVRRTLTPGSMRAANGDLMGWGMAMGAYKAATAPAIAKLRLDVNGSVRVSVGGHEMGQGLRTAIALTVVRVLGVPVGSIEILIGDTGVAPQHLTAGSWGTASVLPPVEAAATQLLADLREQAGSRAGASATVVELLGASGRKFAQAESRNCAPGQPEQVFERLAAGLVAPVGPEYPDFVSFSFVAHFVEVCVEPTTGRIRVPRVVSVVDCGTVASLRTARSQVEGAVVWGIGAALREVSEVDPRYGGFLNADLAEYVLPVAADIGRIDVDFIGKPDLRLNPQGVKGLGEVAMVGVAAAIANAVFHATGKRMRHLPIRIDDLLARRSKVHHKSVDQQ